ncbi:ATP-dependent Clp protease ATP-binding subunit [Aerococcaceae bacterium NML210727]|nr:ATP-dependent Clp protease ATP-binding subunit [Aerococcaceae bacterium NML210727]MCW6654586.1 ATP-dependent Clp protease ATP-binding subunit [Aerococcaceae bacterium NML201296]
MIEEIFTPSARQAMLFAAEQAYLMRNPAVGTEHILLGLAKEETGIAGQVLREVGADYESLLLELELIHGKVNAPHEQGEVVIPYAPRAKKIIMHASNDAKRLGAPKVGTEHLLMGAIKEESLAVALLKNLSIDIEALQRRVYELIGIAPSATQALEGGRRVVSASRSGSSRTPTLDSVARDLTQLARENRLDPVVGREKEVRRMTQIISRRQKNNPVLVGEPGVGKTAIVEGMAQRMVAGQVPADIARKRLLMLDVGALVAGTKYRGEFEERMKKIIEEITVDREVILFIDELHTLIGAGGAEGAIDAANILKPALARGEIQVIGATTLDEYQKYIEKDAALERRFSKVQVDEPSIEDSIAIIEGLKERYEQHHKVVIADEAVQAAVKLSARYMTSRRLPDKAIDLIDEAAAKVRIDQSVTNTAISQLEQQLHDISGRKEQAVLARDFDRASELRKEEQEVERALHEATKEELAKGQDEHLEVTANHVAEVVALATGVPVQQMEMKESKRLVNLESELHKRVIGQHDAVASVARAIRRARSGLKNPKRPIGSFLFLGPTGVGKTELAKTLAASMFGSEENIVRVDMSEYMEKHAVSRLIGSPPGYIGHDEAGQLTEKIRQKPYSVVLLDEVEKAHPDIFNILLQVFDDGHLTDSKGRKVDFRNTIIIMTSNLGATALRDEKSVGFGAKSFTQGHAAMEKRIREELKRAFRPEFLNRIDETIVFHALTKEEIREIVRLHTEDIVKRLSELDIKARITDTAVGIIAEAGFDPEYGARPIRRAIQKQIEDELSEMLLNGDIAQGDTITIGGRSGKINIANKSK